MKKVIAVMLLAAALLLAACGQNGTPAQPTESGSAQIANPWHDVTEAEARAIVPQSVAVPDGAENAAWSVMEADGEPALVQLAFDLNGLSFTARQQQTGDRDKDLSGMYYTWTSQDSFTLRNGLTGTMYRSIGETETADLCVWYDELSGTSYSLGVTAEDLDGFDLRAVADALFPPTVPTRQDGERFEAVILLEGMEETVRYEHIRNDSLGFEMNYDYEQFRRQSEADRECFVSVWDDAANPENYLEVTHSSEDAQTVAAAISEALSKEYELRREDSFLLDLAGSCIRIDASADKGGLTMPDHLQMVYIIPAGDGCFVATEHYAIEGAEGFGRRFQYMMNSFSLLAG